ncbi:hypothetical protein FRC00_008473 [Tulasnella sp. 408]|nr:hypothetical protein FRC00_008473 [Tulasnella sp. 408]
MTSAGSENLGHLFIVAGRPLLFDLGLIKQEELIRELTRTIRDFGGKLVTPQDPDTGLRYVLYDQNDHVPSLVAGLARRMDRICLKWDWILDCHEHKRIVTEKNYSGNRFIPTEPQSNRSLAPPEVLGVDHPNPKSQPLASTSSAHRLRSPSMPRTPLSSAASTSYEPQDHVSPDGPEPVEGKSASRRSHKRKRGESTLSRSKKSRQSNGKAPKVPDKADEEEDIDGVALAEVEPSESYLPPPPKKAVKNEWFGYDYTEDDYEYMKQCVTAICERFYDPDFKQLWKDMAKAAKHHNAPGWRHYFEKNEGRLANEIPALRRLYESSSDEEDAKDKSARSSKKAAWKPKEAYKDRSTEEKVSEDDRRKLIKFMADAPDGGVTQEELLQNFCRLVSRMMESPSRVLDLNPLSAEHASFLADMAALDS